MVLLAVGFLEQSASLLSAIAALMAAGVALAGAFRNRRANRNLRAEVRSLRTQLQRILQAMAQMPAPSRMQLLALIDDAEFMEGIEGR